MTDETRPSDDADADPDEWVPLEDRTDDGNTEQLNPFGGVTDEDDSRVADGTEGDDDGLYPWAQGRGSTSGDAPWQKEDLPDEQLATEPDVPGSVNWLGQIGVYLGVIAVVLAVGGVSLAAADIQPIANMALVASLVLISGAMLVAIVFQVYASELSV